jgi:hypothetical protein
VPFLPLSGMIGQMRIYMADTDSNDPAMSDSICTSILNKWYYLWHERVERRLVSVTATASGFSFAQAATSATSTPTNWYEIAEAYKASGVGVEYGAPLEIVPPTVLLRLQNSHTTQGTVSKVAFMRPATALSASVGKWTCIVHPIPDAATYISLMVRQWPTALSISTDTPDVTELAAYTISKLAAAEGAAIFGEDAEFIGNMVRDIPDEVFEQLKMPRPGLISPTAQERAA